MSDHYCCPVCLQHYDFCKCLEKPAPTHEAPDGMRELTQAEGAMLDRALLRSVTRKTTPLPAQLLRELVEADNAVKALFAKWDVQLKASGTVEATIPFPEATRRDAAWQAAKNWYATQQLPEGCVTIGDLVQSYRDNPKRAAAMDRARARIDAAAAGDTVVLTAQEWDVICAHFPGAGPPPRVTRFEVIDHTTNGEGRVFVKYDVAVELSYQDGGRTLKAFVTEPK